MARNIKTTRDYGFPRVDNKIKTTKAPLIGFEWEVPMDWEYAEGEDEDFADYPYESKVCKSSYKYASNNGFNFHTECGCGEFASPVGNTVEVARRVARHLIEYTKTDPLYTMEDNPNNAGGIHVSVSDKDSAFHRDTFLNLKGLLNRKSSYEFIWEFSGRERQEYQSSCYKEQARASCWDINLGGYPWMKDDMLKNQSNRIEYRLWANFPEYLLPAIDFAHSTYVFCRSSKEIPYLKDYKKWLFKTHGYKALKEFKHADWSLIND